MKKRDCSTCDWYGKCDISVESCQDWLPFGGTTVTLNVEDFDRAWRRRHVRSAWKSLLAVFPEQKGGKLHRLHEKAIQPTVEEELEMDARRETNARFLAGKTSDAKLKELEGLAYDGALEEAHK